MATKTLPEILRLLRGAPQQVYLFDEDGDGNAARATAAEVKAAKKQIAFEEDPRDNLPSFDVIDMQDGDALYTSDNVTREQLEKLLEAAEDIYVVETDHGQVYLTEAAYEDLKPHQIYEFEFDTEQYNSYNVLIDLTAGTLKIGCQKYSIVEWQRRGAAIVRSELGTSEEAEEATKTLLMVLPLIQTKQREISGTRRSRAKSAGRRSRRSSGRSRRR